MFAPSNSELHGVMVITSHKTGILIVLAVSCAEVAFGDHRFQSDNNNKSLWVVVESTGHLNTGFSGKGM